MSLNQKTQYLFVELHKWDLLLIEPQYRNGLLCKCAAKNAEEKIKKKKPKYKKNPFSLQKSTMEHKVALLSLRSS